MSGKFSLYEYDGEPYWHCRDVSANEVMLKWPIDTWHYRAYERLDDGELTEVTREYVQDHVKKPEPRIARQCWRAIAKKLLLAYKPHSGEDYAGALMKTGCFEHAEVTQICLELDLKGTE